MALSDSSEPKNKRPKSSRRRPKIFQAAWMDVPAYKNWLRKDEDNTKFRCAVCDKLFIGGISEIKKHSTRDYHLKKMGAFPSFHTLSMSSTSSTNSNENIKFNDSREKFSDEDLVKEASNRLSAFVAEEGIAFSKATNFLNMIKKVCKNPDILQKVTLCRIKCNNIVDN